MRSRSSRVSVEAIDVARAVERAVVAIGGVLGDDDLARLAALRRSAAASTSRVSPCSAHSTGDTKSDPQCRAEHELVGGRRAGPGPLGTDGRMAVRVGGLGVQRDIAVAATAERGVMTTGQPASRTSAPDTLPSIARRSGP